MCEHSFTICKLFIYFSAILRAKANATLIFDLCRFNVTVNWIPYESIWKRCRFRFNINVGEYRISVHSPIQPDKRTKMRTIYNKLFWPEFQAKISDRTLLCVSTPLQFDNCDD